MCVTVIVTTNEINAVCKPYGVRFITFRGQPSGVDGYLCSLKGTFERYPSAVWDLDVITPDKLEELVLLYSMEESFQ